jgi:hypothetical protein
MTLVVTGKHVGDTENLPVWAQRHIERLERRAKQAEQELADHLERGDFVPGQYNACRVPRAVTLHSAESQTTWGALGVRFERDHAIEVTTSGRLVIETAASNVVTIRNKDAAE